MEQRTPIRSTASTATTPSPAKLLLRKLLGLGRPQTRGECVDGPRPCPWVGCRHHLLLEVAEHQGNHPYRDPALALNKPVASRRRRKRLASSAAEVLVDLWIDEAIERLMTMEDSCSLDVADRNAGGEMFLDDVGRKLGFSQSDATRCLQQARINMSQRLELQR